MSTFDAALLQYESENCQFEHMLSQLEQQWPIREQVSIALNEANTAFAAQCTHPDGHTFMQTCDNLIRFLDLKIPLEYTEQKLVVQVLQVACAMHENAIGNPSLTPTQRSFHYLATTSLLPLSKIVEGSVTDIDLWCEVLSLTLLAEQAHTRATHELDLSKYLNLKHTKDDQLASSGSENGTGHKSATPSLVLKTSKPNKLSGSVHDTAVDVHLTPRSASLKERALAMLNDQPHKTAALGRRHTMPTLTPTAPSVYPSRTTSSKVCSRGDGLYALQEAEE